MKQEDLMPKKSRAERAFALLGRAYERYVRRESAWRVGDLASPIWGFHRSAAGLVRESRDLAGRLEAVAYDGR